MAEFEKTLTAVRHQEVPLNVLFNILMHLLPARIKNQLLNSFMTTEPVSFEQPVDYLRTHDLPEKFGLGGSVEHLQAEVKQVIDEVVLGWASWQAIGNVLNEELQALDTGESSELLKRLLGDFLSEMRQRKLWD